MEGKGNCTSHQASLSQENILQANDTLPMARSAVGKFAENCGRVSAFRLQDSPSKQESVSGQNSGMHSGWELTWQISQDWLFVEPLMALKELVRTHGIAMIQSDWPYFHNTFAL